MQDNISPEERLLRLIRKGSRKSSQKEKSKAREPDVSHHEEKAAKVLSKEKQAKKPFLSGIFKLNKTKLVFSFASFNRILLMMLLILGIYLLVDFVIANSDKIEEKILSLGTEEPASLEILPKDAGQEKPKAVSYYSKPVKSRNLFTAPTATAKKVLLSPTFREMVSKLRLQGIISGLVPQAVIEDTKTKQIYFLSPGESIGEIELKEILPGKVRLNYRGQEAELAL